MAKRRQTHTTHKRIYVSPGEKVIKQGDLVKHVSDINCNKFGLGIVTDIVISKTHCRMRVAKVVWQDNPSDTIYPPDLFTFDGLTVISEASKEEY